MASQKPNSPQGQQNGGAAQGAGGAAQGVRDTAQDVGQRIQQGVAGARDQAQEAYAATSDAVAHRYRQAEGMIARNPGQSVLIGFGVGLGLGVLLSALVSSRREETWYERYVPDYLRNMHVPDYLRNMHVPDSLRNIPERFREGAESIASRIPRGKGR